MSTFSLVELRFVFLHELAHLKRRDLLVNWVMTAVQVLHWFNPLVWLAFARWRADRELACDAMALEAAGQAQNKDYGRTILRLLESFTHPMKTPGLVGILEDKRQLRRRIGMIASFVPTPGWPRLALLLIAVLAVIGLTDAQSPSRSATVTPTEQITSLNEKLIEQKALCTKLEKELVEFQTIQATNSTELAYVLATINPDTTLSDLLDKLHESQQKFVTETNDLGLANPDVVSTRGLIDTLQREIKDRVTGIMHGMETQVAATEAQAAWFTNQMNEFREQPDQQKDDAMNKSKIAAPVVAGLLALATPATTVNVHGADTPPAPVATSQLPDALTGAWISVGTTGHIIEAPTTGGEYLFYAGSHWCLTQADPKYGVVVSHRGGTYHIKGNDSYESTEYSNPGTMATIGDNGKYSIQIQGDLLTFNDVDDPRHYVFKRLKPDAGIAESPLAGKLTGVWMMISAPNEIGNGPLPGKDFKFCVDGHFCCTYSDPKSGVVIEHHGGTYTLDGDTYSETVNYANPDRMNLIGHTFKFAIKFQGDTMTVDGIGNSWNEVWKRAE